MATTKEAKQLNVYQKLIKSRLDILNSNVEKSGKNAHILFKYFKLEDIVPVMIKTFEKNGLLGVFNLENERATLDVINIDNPQESIRFEMPIGDIKDSVIKSKSNTSNPLIQTYGAVHTYTRRYLFMQALDIVEHDEEADLDAKIGSKEIIEKSDKASSFVVETTPPKYTPPKTTEERAEIVKEITGSGDEATEEQKNTLKLLMTELLEVSGKKPKYDKAVQGIMLQTDNLTKISSKVCLEKIKTIEGLIDSEKVNTNT